MKGLVKSFYDITGGDEISRGYMFWQDLQQEILNFVKKELNDEKKYEYAKRFGIQTRQRVFNSQYNEEIESDDGFIEMVINENPIAMVYSSRNQSNSETLIITRIPWQRIKDLTEAF